jgi:hypothetical protein
MIKETATPNFNARFRAERSFSMSKTAKGLLIAALCVLTTWMGIACLYTYSVSEELTTLRRESRSDTVYLRCRIRDLESELAAERAKEQTPPAEAVGGNPAETQRGEATAPAETEEGVTSPTETRPASKPDSATEEVTLPVHQSPETQAPDEETTDAPVSLYLIAEHNGIIGLFDTSGALLRSVNVFVMTLPKSDREALAVGIPASSWEEALTLLDRFS